MDRKTGSIGQANKSQNQNNNIFADVGFMIMIGYRVGEYMSFAVDAYYIDAVCQQHQQGIKFTDSAVVNQKNRHKYHKVHYYQVFFGEGRIQDNHASYQGGCAGYQGQKYN